MSLPPVNVTMHLPMFTIFILVSLAVMLPASLSILSTKIVTHRLWLPPGILITLITTSTICLFLITAFWKNTLSIHQNHILAKAGFYKILLEYNDLDEVSIKKMESLDWENYKPMMRTNGISIFQYHVGHFLSSNKGSVFLLIVGNSSIDYLVSVNDSHIITNLPIGDLIKDSDSKWSD